MDRLWWEDGTVQIPRGLLTDKVPGEAVAVYAKMKGFGPEARMALKQLADRLGWSEATTRKWQAWLHENEWLVLLKEGAKHDPREWWMCREKGEQPPPEVWERVGVLPGVGGRGIKICGPAKIDTLNIEGVNKSLDKPLDKPPIDSKGEWQKTIDAYYEQFKAHPSNPEHLKPVLGAQDFGALKNLLKKGVTHEQIRAALPAFFKDDFAQRQGFRLAWFASSFNALRLAQGGRASAGGRQGRQYHDPGCDPLEPSEG